MKQQEFSTHRIYLKHTDGLHWIQNSNFWWKVASLYCQFLSNVNQMHIHWRVWQVSESIKGAPAEYNTNSVVWGDVNRQAEKAWRGDAESPSLPGNHNYMSNPKFSHSRELNGASWWTLWERYPITPCWSACLSTWWESIKEVTDIHQTFPQKVAKPLTPRAAHITW